MQSILFCELSVVPDYFDIKTPEHFDYERSRNRSEKEVAQKIEGDSFYKALRFDEELLAVKVGPIKNAIRVELLNSKLNANRKGLLREHFTICFDLKTDLKGFYKLAKKDSILAPLAKRYRGQHLHCIPDLFETLCWAIIGQQINVSFAHDVKTDFVKKYGDKVKVEDRTLYVFPTWQKVLRIKESSLQALRFSRQKACYVKEVAKAMKAGLNKERLEKLDYASAMEALIKIKGVGTWTANYVLLRCLSLGDAFPVKDVALQKAFQIQLGLDKKPKAAELLHYQEGWKPYCHYATLYLWRSLADA